MPDRDNRDIDADADAGTLHLSQLFEEDSAGNVRDRQADTSPDKGDVRIALGGIFIILFAVIVSIVISQMPPSQPDSLFTTMENVQADYTVIIGRDSDILPELGDVFCVHVASPPPPPNLDSAAAATAATAATATSATSHDRFVVVERDEHIVRVFNLQSDSDASDSESVSLVVTIGTPGEIGDSPQHFHHPHSAWLCDDGHVLVADEKNGRVQEFNADGTFDRTLFDDNAAPWSLFLTSDGLLYFSETDHYGYSRARITVLERSTGTIVRRFDLKYVHRPTGIVVDSTGVIYIADYGWNRVVVLNPDGSVKQTIGGPRRGSELGQFDHLWGIGLSPDQDFLLVADSHNFRVQILRTSDGEPVTYYGRNAIVHQPFGVATTSNGDILVANKNHQIVRISLRRQT
jgi:NHL repeat